MKYYHLTLVNEEEVINRAIDRWGKEKQLTHCVEEMSELTTKIMQYMFRPGRESEVYDDLIEELADARLMIDCAIKAIDKYAVEKVMQNKIAKMFKQISI